MTGDPSRGTGMLLPILQPLVDAGARPAHVDRVRRAWLAGRAIERVAERPGFVFPSAARPALAAVAADLERLAGIASEHESADRSVRMVLRLADGATIETVLLRNDTVCVSTQAGCAVGCTFCMTGRGGLERQLAVEEIVAQVALVRRRRPVRRVVFMGMGEPGHNLAALLPALCLLGRDAGLGHKELVVSTVGAPAFFARLAANDVRPALALSLHTTDPQRRRALLPRAPRHEPAALVAAALAYAEGTGHPLQIQWTLLAGVNDGDDELDRLIPWLAGRRVVVNLIPFNPVPGTPFRRTPADRAHALSRRLHRAGIHAKLRRSAGADVDGACGQLRARVAGALD